MGSPYYWFVVLTAMRTAELESQNNLYQLNVFILGEGHSVDQTPALATGVVT
jgi:hypothetical protein